MVGMKPPARFATAGNKWLGFYQPQAALGLLEVKNC